MSCEGVRVRGAQIFMSTRCTPEVMLSSRAVRVAPVARAPTTVHFAHFLTWNMTPTAPTAAPCPCGPSLLVAAVRTNWRGPTAVPLQRSARTWCPRSSDGFDGAQAARSAPMAAPAAPCPRAPSVPRCFYFGRKTDFACQDVSAAAEKRARWNCRRHPTTAGPMDDCSRLGFLGCCRGNGCGRGLSGIALELELAVPCIGAGSFSMELSGEQFIESSPPSSAYSSLTETSCL